MSPPRSASKKKRKLDAIDQEIADLDEKIKRREMEKETPDEPTAIAASVRARLYTFTSYQLTIARRDLENVLFNISVGPTHAPPPPVNPPYAHGPAHLPPMVLQYNHGPSYPPVDPANGHSTVQAQPHQASETEKTYEHL